MAKSRKLHWSFAGGELSPEMFGHVSDASFQIGAAKEQNFIVTPHGPARRRPGFEYQTTTKNGVKARLIPFVFSTADTLIIELGPGYFRFFDDSGAINYSGTPVAWQAHEPTAAITNGSSEFTGIGVPFSVGHRVWVVNAPTPFEASKDYFIVDVPTASSIRLSAVKGGAPILATANSVGNVEVYRRYTYGDVVVDAGNDYYCVNPHINQQPSVTTGWYWYHITGTALELPNDYKAADIFDVTYTQSADILTLAHPKYPVTELLRFGDAEWTIRRPSFFFNIQVPAPTGASVTPSYGRRFTILNLATPGNTYLSTNSPHELAEGDGVFISGGTVSAGTVPSGYYVASDVLVAQIGSPSGNVLRLKNIADGTYFYDPAIAGYSANSAVLRYTPISADADNTYLVTAVNQYGVESGPSTEVTALNNVLYVEGSYNTVYWVASTGAKKYRIYKQQSGLFGYIGEVEDDGSSSYTFKDDNIAPDMGLTPGIADDSLTIRSSTVTMETTGDTITWANHDLRANDLVWFLNAPSGADIVNGTHYFVSASGLTNSVFRVSATLGGAALNLPNGTATAYTGDHPGAVAYFEQRRCFAGSRRVPQGLWMTRTGTEADLRYSLPVKDDDRVSVVVSSQQASTIRHIVPMDHLLLLTSSTEYRVTPLNDDGITPKSISVRPQTEIGSSTVRPIVANNTLVFCAARGGHVREMGFQAAAQGFVTGDLSLRAAHLFDSFTITDSAQMKSPHSILWFVSSSGKLLSLTYIPEESVGGWTQHTTNNDADNFVSVAVIPEGDEDRVWVVVERNGIHTVEKMASQRIASLAVGFFVDSGYTETVAGAAYAAGDTFPVSGTTIDHLADKTVAVLVDGVSYPQQVVTSTPNSRITMPVAAAIGKIVTVGLPYTSELQTMPFSAQTESFAQGIRKNVNKVWVRVYESSQFEVGPSTSDLRASNIADTPAGALTSAEIDITLLGEWTDDGQIVIRQSNPHPLTVVSATTLVTYGGD